MGTNCAPLVADLFLFCYERDFMKNLYNDAKRRVYGKNLAKKQKCSVPCSVLFSSRYIDEIKIFRQRFVSGSG